MPVETITITIGAGSANPQSKQIQINVDPVAGSGSGTVSFTGAHGGLDTAQATATIAGSPYTSNAANLAWQATNGAVSLLNNLMIQGYTNPGGHSNWDGIGAPISSLIGPFNTVIVNQPFNNTPISGLVSPDGHSGEYEVVPPHVNLVTATGTWASDSPLPFQNSFICTFQGSIVVSTPGVHTFYWLVDDSWALYMGPNVIDGQTPARSQGTMVINGGNLDAPASANLVIGTLPAWPLIGTRNTGGLSNIGSTDYIYINFPTVGIYPFMIWWINNPDATTFHQMTYTPGSAQIPTGQFGPALGGVILPVAAQAAPSATTPSGNLQLSLANGNFHIVGDTVTLNVNVNGIHYATKSYIPLLEGTIGKIFVYNSPSSNVFNFPLYNGNPVDKPTAAGATFALTGNNTSWQGLLSITYDGTNFDLSYNGGGFISHSDTTQLTITNNDIAWFDSTNKAYDVFAASVSGGGIQSTIEIDYMVNPNPFVASVTPTTVPADGQQHIFTINLTKPISPQQQGAFNTGNTIAITTSWSGGVTTVGTPSPILDAQGWLTGWNVTASVPVSSVNVSASLNATIQGNLTYLNGTTFTVGNVVYVNNLTIATITLQGQALAPPVFYSFSPSVSGTSGTVNINISATVYNPTNVSNTVSFLLRVANSSSQSTLGTSSVPTSSSTGIVNGQTVFFKTYQISVVESSLPPSYNLGFSCVDQNSLSMSPVYWGSTVYTYTTSGGGGGCPAVEMYISEYHQVANAIPDMLVQVLEGEVNQYLTALPSTELTEIVKVEYSDEICYHLRAENGAQVVVSGSTPVPTQENLAMWLRNEDPTRIPALAYILEPGMHVITDLGNEPEWSPLVEVQCLGVRRVAHLNCGGRNFAAGVEPGKYIYTHNSGAIVK
jgi:hypothetical protein